MVVNKVTTEGTAPLSKRRRSSAVEDFMDIRKAFSQSDTFSKWIILKFAVFSLFCLFGLEHFAHFHLVPSGLMVGVTCCLIF